ncbi:hypothetical protein Tco_1483779 [Tanacetum coccineum]
METKASQCLKYSEAQPLSKTGEEYLTLRNFNPLPEVPRGKGKEKECEEKEQAAQFSQPPNSKEEELGTKYNPSETILPSGNQDGGQAGLDHGTLDEGQAGSDPGTRDEGQAGSNPGTLDEGQAGSDPGTRDEGQAGPNPDDINIAESLPLPTPSVLAGPNLELSDVEITRSLSVNLKPVLMDKGFTASASLMCIKNLKLTVDGTSYFSFGDQFLNDKPSEADNEKTTADTEAESMASVAIQQDTSITPPITSPVIDLVSRPHSPNVHWPFYQNTTITTAAKQNNYSHYHLNFNKAMEALTELNPCEEVCKDFDDDKAQEETKKKGKQDSPKPPLGSPPLPTSSSTTVRRIRSFWHNRSFDSAQAPPPPPPVSSTRQEDQIWKAMHSENHQSVSSLTDSSPFQWKNRHKLLTDQVDDAIIEECKSPFRAVEDSLAYLKRQFRIEVLFNIDEALDYAVKEFQIKRIIQGSCSYEHQILDEERSLVRSKDFMFAIQERLKDTRIFRILESFVGGKYPEERRLRFCLKRTD